MSNRNLALALYRALLRSCRALETSPTQQIAFRLPVDPDNPSTHPQTYPVAKDYRNRVLEQLFPKVSQLPEASGLSSESVRSIIREEFRAGANADPSANGKLLDQAMEALRVFAEQVQLSKTCSSTITHGIHVEVVPGFISKMPHPGNPGASRWLWAYRCQIENQRDTEVQLFGRHWIILDASSRVSAEVPRFSPGVVGHQPLIQPGAMFEYHSFTDLETPKGSMQGCFHCVTVDAQGQPDEPIDARIKPFQLISPDASLD